MQTPLPIDEHLPGIFQNLSKSRALVLVAEPGAGKTTRVPPALLRSGMLDAQHPTIVMLQPRRVAARASAMRIADENNWRIGEEVGWHVRFDRKITDRTRLRVLTEGILTRQLVDDPFMEGVGAVIVDEFHERSIHADLSLALLREIRLSVRNDLIVIVMSATLEAEPVAAFLGDCPIVRVPGRTFPIEYDYAKAPSSAPMPPRIAQTLSGLIEQDEGDVLVFLPGVSEINRTAAVLAPLARQFDLEILPLHGSLSPDEQIRALAPMEKQKIILATNIAETSLTIDGVRTVVDSGLARVAGFDAQRGLDDLQTQRISKASATQRAGRAGRTGPGRCIRLYTEKEFHAMQPFELPEIRRVDLASTILALHAWGKPNVREFGWFEAPSEHAIASAERLLEMLGAIKGNSITSLGREMLALPLHPRLSRLLIAATNAGYLEEGATMAALLSERDLLALERSADRAPSNLAESDLLVRFDLVKSSPNVVRIRDELIRLGRRLKFPSVGTPGEGQSGAQQRTRSRRPSPQPSPGVPGEGEGPDHEILLKLVLLAYPDRVCRRRANDHSAAVMVGGTGVRLAPESVVQQHEFFIALDARQDQRSDSREALVRMASGIDVEWLEELFPDQIVRDRTPVFDPQRRRVVGLGTTKYRDLVLREDRDAPVDSEKAGDILAEALMPEAEAIVGADEGAAELIARLELLRKHMPEHPWPDVSAAEMLREICRGKKSVEELSRVSISPILLGKLQYPLDRLLAEHAPATVEVPSGSHIRIQYARGQSPILAVRLQELFGWMDTPRIAAGRVSLVLHLLGPNYRPVQITDDLRSFWKTTYFQVRKDLRVRYPKHSWPEDPLTATPVAKGGRRR